MCGCCGAGLWLLMAAEAQHNSQPQTPSCQGLALASTSLPDTNAFAAKKLVDPKAKPWDDYRVWGVFRTFLVRP